MTAPAPAVAVREILRDIRFEQTLFSLPFAVLAMFLAAEGLPSVRTVGLVLVALVGGRSAAMAVNRAADARIDARNPRTADRAIPAGRVSRSTMWGFAAAATGLFLWAAWSLNPLCLVLSPVALAFLIGYSWTKRVTAFCHLILGCTLGIAPLGAWVAVRGTFLTAEGAVDLTPWLLGLGVATWVAGFDVLYSCPDVDVDERERLHSIPGALGVSRAFFVSRGLHVWTIGLFAAAGVASVTLGPAWWGALAVGAVILGVEHLLVRPGDYRRMGVAFFRMNAAFGAVMLLGASVDVFV